jgi:hypothetical protein
MLVECVEAGRVLGVSDRQIVRMNDEQLRIRGVAETFGNGLGLSHGGQRGEKKCDRDSKLAKTHGKLQ